MHARIPAGRARQRAAHSAGAGACAAPRARIGTDPARSPAACIAAAPWEQQRPAADSARRRRRHLVAVLVLGLAVRLGRRRRPRGPGRVVAPAPGKVNEAGAQSVRIFGRPCRFAGSRQSWQAEFSGRGIN